MKILLCADIHGNYQALQALLKTKCAKTADKIIVLGDLVCMGPEPNEVIETIRENPKIQCVMGNHDKWVSVGAPPSAANSKRIKIKHHEYMKAVITDENLEFLRRLPYFIKFNHLGVKYYFTHYGWKDKFIDVIEHPEEIESKDNINSIFGRIKADCIFFGHNHDPLEFEANNKKYICVGTLGMSKYGNYVVLNIDENGDYLIERKTLNIQRFKTLKIMKQLKYPRYNLYAGYLLGTFVSIYQQEHNDDLYHNPKHSNLLFTSNKKQNKCEKNNKINKA